MACAFLFNLTAVNFTGVTLSVVQTLALLHADKFLKHNITPVYIGSVLAPTRYFSCLDHSAAVGMHITLCIPLLIAGLVQGVQPWLHPRVTSLRERIKESDRTHW